MKKYKDHMMVTIALILLMFMIVGFITSCKSQDEEHPPKPRLMKCTVPYSLARLRINCLDIRASELEEKVNKLEDMIREKQGGIDDRRN